MDFYDIHNRLNQILHDKLRTEHGDAAITREPVTSEFSGRNLGDIDVPADPLQAVKEAEQIADVARFLANDQAKKARRHGRSWTEIAEAFGIEAADENDDPAVDAFQRVAGSGWQAVTSWRCACCEQRVTDRGPWESNPVDDERGHARDCERHQREITAYERRFDDDFDHDRDESADWEMEL